MIIPIELAFKCIVFAFIVFFSPYRYPLLKLHAVTTERAIGIKHIAVDGDVGRHLEIVACAVRLQR